MVLAADVKDLSGRMLLMANTEIVEKHLRVLRTWGIMGVEVLDEVDAELESASDIEPAPIPEHVSESIKGELDERFRGVDISHPFMKMLVELTEKNLVKQYLAK